jgi:hypothetical protein
MPNDNHHWVPKFLIKNFTDVDGRVFRLDIFNDRTTKVPPKHAASALNFNEFRIDGKVVSFEDELEKIETRAAPILKRIAASHSITGLKDKEKSSVANFTAAQSFRTEAFYKGLDPDLSRQEFGTVFGQLWRSAFIVSAEIERRRWAVMKIEHDDVFYLGDHPVVLQDTENPSAAGQLGFDVQGVEAFLPLSPTCALYMPCTSISEQIITGYENALWMHRRTRSAALRGQHLVGTDEQSLQLSQRVMRNSHALYQALTTGVAFAAAPENVENLNYLQCAWAHAAVYSNCRDFSFAKQVFSQTPQYRKTPRVAPAAVGIGRPKRGTPA